MSSEGVTTPLHPEVRIVTGSGSITVIAESRGDVIADGKAQVDTDENGALEIKNKSRSLTVRCPEGTNIVAGTRSGSIRLHGSLGSVRATTLSGHVEADHVASADIRAMSGSVEVAACDGICRVKTKSGSTHIRSAGAVEVSIGSGTITVDNVTGAARARAISGSVQIGARGEGRVEAETMSGSITITLPPACRPTVKVKSLSSKPRVDVTQGQDCEVLARTLSGGITVRST
jgi:DUF4097 and DUF4098 domain-containing protein YvlB